MLEGGEHELKLDAFLKSGANPRELETTGFVCCGKPAVSETSETSIHIDNLAWFGLNVTGP